MSWGIYQRGVEVYAAYPFRTCILYVPAERAVQEKQ